MPHRWDFSNIHNKEILMQSWTTLNYSDYCTFSWNWVVSRKMEWDASSWKYRTKAKKVADLNLRFILFATFVVVWSWTLKYCWVEKRQRSLQNFIERIPLELNMVPFDVWKGSTDETYNSRRPSRSFCLAVNGLFGKITLGALDLRDLVAFLRLRKLAWDSFP